MPHSQISVCFSKFLGCLVLAGSANLVLAQTAYKCGNTYSQTPCPGGVQIDTPDTRTVDQRDASAKVTRDSEKVVKKLASERKKRERADLALSSKARLGVIEKPKEVKVKRTTAVPIMVKQPKTPKAAAKKAAKPATQDAEVVKLVKPPMPPKPPKPKKPAKSSAA